jgi:hypothetical protein
VELTNEFRVPVPVEQAWAILTDVERIAPCMPGAELQEVAGEEYRGVVKVKVGPITAQYRGAARFASRDDANHVAVLRAEGRETRGQGNASATITATLRPDGDATVVSVVTDLTVTGKVAQFGRGVLADVSAKLLEQFVSCLEADVLSGAPAGAGKAEGATVPATEGATGGAGAASPSGGASGDHEVRKVASRPAEPVDLLGTAGVPVAKRVAPVVALLFLLSWLLRRRRKHRRATT